MFFAVVFGVPWLIWKLLSALCECLYLLESKREREKREREREREREGGGGGGGGEEKEAERESSIHTCSSICGIA